MNKKHSLSMMLHIAEQHHVVVCSTSVTKTTSAASGNGFKKKKKSKVESLLLRKDGKGAERCSGATKGSVPSRSCNGYIDALFIEFWMVGEQ